MMPFPIAPTSNATVNVMKPNGHSHSFSSEEESNQNQTKKTNENKVSNQHQDEDPCELIAQLCEQFYHLGWVSGTGGGISIVKQQPTTTKTTTNQSQDTHKHSFENDFTQLSSNKSQQQQQQQQMTNYYYVAPSGVQKERIQAEDMFILKQIQNQNAPNQQIDFDSDLFELTQQNEIPLKLIQSPPSWKRFKPSQCTPLFFSAFTMRNASACIHTHSQWAVLATMLSSSRDHFAITHQEMIKGIAIGSTNSNWNYFDTIYVPIIENTPIEADLTQFMKAALIKYPLTNCILVRRHGCYVWGETWQKAKIMAECYDYLFKLACELHKYSIQPEQIPQDSLYKLDNQINQEKYQQIK